MGSIGEIRKAAEGPEIQPASLEDAIEVIASLRATVDEQQDYIDMLEEDSEKRVDGLRERLVMKILPSMIEKFGADLNSGQTAQGDFGRMMIASNAVKLADAVKNEMGYPKDF